MKTWIEAKDAYMKDHLSKPLKAPNIRLNALKNIETALIANDRSLLKDHTIFKKYSKASLVDLYLSIKGEPLNSAEKSVVHELYKFSK